MSDFVDEEVWCRCSTTYGVLVEGKELGEWRGADSSAEIAELRIMRGGILSWDALWVDPVHSDDHYCLLIPPLFQSDPVHLLNGYSFNLFP